MDVLIASKNIFKGSNTCQLRGG